jgi:hypothetical protein
LRNNRLIHNVTRSSARKLWQYAISEFEEHPIVPTKVKWLGDIGLSSAHKRAGKVRYDVVQRDSAGSLHIYYGVTEDGIHGPWKALIEREGGEPIEVAEAGEAEVPEGEQFGMLQETERREPEFDDGGKVEIAELPLSETGANIARELEPAPTGTEEAMQWHHPEMGVSGESVPPIPGEEGFSKEPTSTGEMGLWIEQVPSTPKQPAHEVKPTEAVQPEMGQDQGPVAPSTSESTTGQEAAQARPPLEISQDIAKMGLALGPVQERGVASASGEAVGKGASETITGTPTGVPSAEAAAHPEPESKDQGH